MVKVSPLPLLWLGPDPSAASPTPHTLHTHLPHLPPPPQVAFGMGVDLAALGAVIHLTMPRSLEDYVQQVTYVGGGQGRGLGEGGSGGREGM